MKTHSKIKGRTFLELYKEVREIYSNLMSDLSNSDIQLISCQLMPCYDVKEIFDINTKFQSIFSVKCSKKTIDLINSGISGLILEQYDVLDGSNDFFNSFFVYLNKIISDNKMLKALMSQRTIEEIEKKFKNRYKISEINDVFVDLITKDDMVNSVNFCIQLKVKREKPDV